MRIGVSQGISAGVVIALCAVALIGAQEPPAGRGGGPGQGQGRGGGAAPPPGVQQVARNPVVDQAARDRAHELFQKRPEWWLPASAKSIAMEHHVPVVYRMSVERLSGRRAARERMRVPLPSKKAGAHAPRWWRSVLAPVLGRKAAD